MDILAALLLLAALVVGGLARRWVLVREDVIELPPERPTGVLDSWAVWTEARRRDR
jgi:hypothetical protein